MTTKTIPTDVVLSITTGKPFCQFPDMQEAVEWLVQEPIFNHQFVDSDFNNAVRRGIYVQIPELEGVDSSHVNRDNWETFRDECVARFGAALTLRPIVVPEEVMEKSKLNFFAGAMMFAVEARDE